MAGQPASTQDAMFATTLGVRDPEAHTRWLIAVCGVIIGAMVLAASPVAIAMWPSLSWQPRSPDAAWVGVTVDEPDSGQDLWLSYAAEGVSISLPDPRAPRPVIAAPPVEVEEIREEPDAEPQPEPPPAETEAEEGEASEEDVEGEADSEGTDETSAGDEGVVDGTGEDEQDRRPMRTSGTSAELAPGEMATCIVRPQPRGWQVRGCADGLHSDAIALAQGMTRRTQVIVTLRGA